MAAGFCSEVAQAISHILLASVSHVVSLDFGVVRSLHPEGERAARFVICPKDYHQTL